MRSTYALTLLPARSQLVRRRIIVIGLTLLLLALSAFHPSVITQAAAGDLDTTFGNGGKVMTDLFAQSEVATAVALQSDGKIVVAGYTAPLANPQTRSDFALARYNPDGTLDASFGNGGKVVTDFDATHQDQAKAVAIQSDGKIIAAGFTSFIGSDDNTDYAFALARYQTDGALDPSFGNHGKVVTNHANPTSFNIYYRESINAIALQNDGKIVASGTAFFNPAQSMDFTTVRYNTDGSLDNSFGTGGKVFTNFASSTAAEPNDSAGEVFIQSDGKILVAGRVHHLTFDYGISRYHSDGRPDLSFGQGGQLTVNALRQGSGNASKETAMTVQADGKILLGGYATLNGISRCALRRFDDAGNADTTFGSSGQVVTNISGAIRSVKMQSNGKILVAGNSSANLGDFTVARYHPSGALDETFTSGGTTTTDFSGSADQLFAAALQSDGKLIAVGAATNREGNFDFAVVRYLSGDSQSGTLYDLCLQDDASKNYLHINSTTGDYLLTRCNDSWLAGTGVVNKTAAAFSLTDESANRLLSVSVNLEKRKAQFSIRTYAPNLKAKMKDRNIDDNSCACP
ncbi:MAG: hypothetical protein HY231_14285 [Acidobacteria bacterium]|nr:hypothetical protein [Acidobacteriota bacterium]